MRTPAKGSNAEKSSRSTAAAPLVRTNLRATNPSEIEATDSERASRCSPSGCGTYARVCMTARCPVESPPVGESLWSERVDDLLVRTASSDPTPGGGSIAAITGAFGLGLVQMAIAVTDDVELAPHRTRADELLAEIVPAADGDVADFTTLMAAYGLPRTDETEQATRKRAVEDATVLATERPLELIATFVEALRLAATVEPLVKRSIVSDVLAGRDVLFGAARAAVRTADINVRALERSASPSAAALRRRRNFLVSEVEAQT